MSNHEKINNNQENNSEAAASTEERRGIEEICRDSALGMQKALKEMNATYTAFKESGGKESPEGKAAKDYYSGWQKLNKRAVDISKEIKSLREKIDEINESERPSDRGKKRKILIDGGEGPGSEKIKQDEINQELEKKVIEYEEQIRGKEREFSGLELKLIALEVDPLINKLKEEIDELNKSLGSGEVSDKYGDLSEDEDGYDKYDFTDPQGWVENEVRKREEEINILEQKKVGNKAEPDNNSGSPDEGEDDLSDEMMFDENKLKESAMKPEEESMPGDSDKKDTDEPGVEISETTRYMANRMKMSERSKSKVDARFAENLSDEQIHEFIKFAEPENIKKDEEVMGDINNLIGQLEKSEAEEDIVAEVCARLENKFGISGGAIEDIFNNQAEEIRKMAEAAIGPRGRGARFRSISLKILKGLGYCALGGGVVLATGGAGLFAGLGAGGIVSLKILDGIRRGRSNNKKAEGEIARIKSEMANNKEIQEDFVNRIVNEVATRKQAEIDGRAEQTFYIDQEIELAEKELIDAETDEDREYYNNLLTELRGRKQLLTASILSNYMENSDDYKDLDNETKGSIIRQANGLSQIDSNLNIDQEMAVKKNPNWFSRMAKRTDQFIGGKTAAEQGATAGVFGIAGVAARKIPIFRNILMAYGGMKGAEALANWRLNKDKKGRYRMLRQIRYGEITGEDPENIKEAVRLGRAQLINEDFRKNNPSDYALLKNAIDIYEQCQLKEKDDDINEYLFKRTEGTEKTIQDKEKLEKRRKRIINAARIGGAAIGAIAPELMEEGREFLKEKMTEHPDAGIEKISIGKFRDECVHKGWEVRHTDKSGVFDVFDKDGKQIGVFDKEKGFVSSEGLKGADKASEDLADNSKEPVIEPAIGFDKMTVREFRDGFCKGNDLELRPSETKGVFDITDRNGKPVGVFSEGKGFISPEDYKAEALDRFRASVSNKELSELFEMPARPDMPPDDIIKQATVGRGEGISDAFMRQLAGGDVESKDYAPDKEHLKAMGYDKDNFDRATIEKWARNLSGKIVSGDKDTVFDTEKFKGMYDTENNTQTWVTEEGKSAYVLHRGEDGKFFFSEYHDRNGDGKFTLAEMELDGSETTEGFEKAQAIDAEPTPPSDERVFSPEEKSEINRLESGLSEEARRSRILSEFNEYTKNDSHLTLEKFREAGLDIFDKDGFSNADRAAADFMSRHLDITYDAKGIKEILELSRASGIDYNDIHFLDAYDKMQGSLSADKLGGYIKAYTGFWSGMDKGTVTEGFNKLFGAGSTGWERRTDNIFVIKDAYGKKGFDILFDMKKNLIGADGPMKFNFGARGGWFTGDRLKPELSLNSDNIADVRKYIETEANNYKSSAPMDRLSGGENPAANTAESAEEPIDLGKTIEETAKDKKVIDVGETAKEGEGVGRKVLRP